SSPCSESQATPSPPQLGEAEPIHIVIPGRLPSWNAILAMEHWARAKYKQQIQHAFLSALQHSASDCSTKTTYVKSTMSTACATLGSYLATQRGKARIETRQKKVGSAAQERVEITVQRVLP